jgi:hypothetical protein
MGPLKTSASQRDAIAPKREACCNAKPKAAAKTCCGGAPQSNASACCVADENAKTRGETGCGCS